MGNGRARWTKSLDLESSTPVRAGGGVVSRTSPSGVPEVLVVHRPRYDDWSFPKGKAEPGEPDQQCALREVEEETGYLCIPGAELAPASYVDRHGRPKTVRYWAMEPVAGQFTPNEEVDRIEWLEWEQAVGLLTYRHDQHLIHQLNQQQVYSASVLLVRHGAAGSRKNWVGDDRLRPLDSRGRCQAQDLVDRLSPYPIKRVISSGYLRCIQTVEPLAAALGLEVERSRRLEEGARRSQVTGLLDGLGTQLAVLCTHGDVSAGLLEPGAPNKKGGVWVFGPQRQGRKPVRYLPPGC